ncbi:MAG: hypothetical protein WCI34_01535 [Actinomycetes bacterium]
MVPLVASGGLLAESLASLLRIMLGDPLAGSLTPGADNSMRLAARIALNAAFT